ncbi:WecB/TagA/CpsF family glycosyltransferase [Patescibacteria group bacterium]
MTRQRTTIMGTQIDRITKPEALGRIESFLSSGRHHVVTPNAEFILQARRNKKFQQVLNDADLAVLDGSGPLIASWFTPIKLKQIIPGSDLAKEVLRMADQRHLKVLLLNSASSLSSTVEIEAAVRRDFPELEIKVLALTPSEYDSQATRDEIGEFAPQILFVGFGSPGQDLWLAENLDRLPSVHLAMGIGGSFDFLSGKRRRAPRWIRRAGLEWLHRLFSRPRGGKYYFGRRLKKIVRSVVWFPIVFVFTFNQG